MSNQSIPSPLQLSKPAPAPIYASQETGESPVLPTSPDSPSEYLSTRSTFSSTSPKRTHDSSFSENAPSSLMISLHTRTNTERSSSKLSPTSLAQRESVPVYRPDSYILPAQTYRPDSQALPSVQEIPSVQDLQNEVEVDNLQVSRFSNNTSLMLPTPRTPHFPLRSTNSTSDLRRTIAILNRADLVFDKETEDGHAAGSPVNFHYYLPHVSNSATDFYTSSDWIAYDDAEPNELAETEAMLFDQGPDGIELPFIREEDFEYYPSWDREVENRRASTVHAPTVKDSEFIGEELTLERRVEKKVEKKVKKKVQKKDVFWFEKKLAKLWSKIRYFRIGGRGRGVQEIKK